MQKLLSLLFTSLSLFLVWCSSTVQPKLSDTQNLPLIEKKQLSVPTNTQMPSDSYVLNEYSTPLLWYLNWISSSKLSITGEVFVVENQFTLSGFKFTQVATPYFDMSIPSWSINWYNITWNDANPWLRSLNGTVVWDSWTLFSFEIIDGTIDISTYQNQFTLLSPSVLNSNEQPWKGFILYWPQICNDGNPCQWWSTPEYIITYPTEDKKTLLIRINHTNDILVSYLLQKTLSTLNLK